MKISLRRCHALTVEDGAFSHKRVYVAHFVGILNLDGHPNRITGSRVTAILLDRWILPFGGASSVEGLRFKASSFILVGWSRSWLSQNLNLFGYP